ncbi:MAG: uroporphyrinogen-III C-methyltransferase [Candidatus Omnitrophica bacterium]|nr:uroporphyrinogen-III C-methyltransferase [Candidatus Omnitrophota bacterium]
MKKGKVYIVGAGPGAEDLITLRGLKVLQQCDVVIYDYLVNKEILKYTNPSCEIICVDELDKDKYSNGFSKRQDLINGLMVKKCKEGKNVVRLKNGDPSIFSRLNEELEVLKKNRIDFRIIPGVSTFLAAGCYLGIPLTARGISSQICITTGHETNLKQDGFVNWEYVSKLDTIVLYMAVENLKNIIDKLIFHGKSKKTPVAVVSNISKINQRYVIGTLDDIVEKIKDINLTAPAVVIIGDVVKKERLYNWFKKTKKILFTGLSSERFFEKGLIFHIPMIEIKELKNYKHLDDYIKKLILQKNVDWIIFTSRYAVYYFFERLYDLGYDTRILFGIKIAAIGSSTANRLKEYGIVCDLVPKRECSLGLIDEFKKILKSSKQKVKIFLPRSDIADKGLTEMLKKLGAIVYPCVVYKNVISKNLPEIDFSFFDEIIFSSPSCVKNFVKRYGVPPEKLKLKSIGKVTEKAVEMFIKKIKS